MIVSAAILTSCSFTTVKLDPKNPVVLKLGAYYSDNQIAELSKLVDKFNKGEGRETGIIVELIKIPSSKGMEQYLAEPASNKSGVIDFPDIFITYKSIVPYLENKIELINFKDYLTENELAEYNTRLVDEGYLSGDKNQLTMMPMGNSTEIMFVNKTDFDKFSKACGAKLEKDNTLEDILNIAKQYYEYTDSLTPYIEQDGKALIGFDTKVNHMLYSLKSMGFDFFTEKGNKYSMNFSEEIARKVWETYCVPTLEGYMAKYAKYTSVDIQSGRLLLAVSSTASSAYISDFVVDDATNDTRDIDITTMPVPIAAGGLPISLQQGGGIFISKTSPLKTKAAVEFFKWLTNKENNTYFSLKCSYMPIRKDNSSKEYINENAEKLDVNKKIQDSIITSLEQTNERVSYVRPYFKNYEKVRNALARILNDDVQEKRTAFMSAFKAGKGSYESLLKEAMGEQSFKKWYKNTLKTLQENMD